MHRARRVGRRVDDTEDSRNDTECQAERTNGDDEKRRTALQRLERKAGVTSECGEQCAVGADTPRTRARSEQSLCRYTVGGFASLHAPRVKSGKRTGAFPFATDCSESGPGTLHAVASYTSKSGASPSRNHCTVRHAMM